MTGFGIVKHNLDCLMITTRAHKEPSLDLIQHTNDKSDRSGFGYLSV